MARHNVLRFHAALFDPGGVLHTRPRCPRLLPSTQITVSTFPLYCCGYPIVHDYTNFEAQSRGLHSRFPRLRTPVTRFTRRVRYWSGG